MNTHRILTILVACFFLACEAKIEIINTEPATTPISSSFSYTNITAIKDIQITKTSPQWSTDTPKDISATYAINPVFADTLGLKFDTKTGTIRGNPTTLLPNTSYTITATGTDLYTNNKTTTVQIAVNKPITGTFSYKIITGTKYNNIGTITPQWKNRSDNNQRITYNISPKPPSWLSFNSISGALSGTPTEPTREIYTITASGTGDYTGSIIRKAQIAISIEISGSFSYNNTSINATENAAIADLTPSWSNVSDSEQKLKYIIRPGLPKGLSFDTSTGAINGTPTAIAQASTRQYRIEARGMLPYKGTINATSTITIALTPLVSYSSIANGTKGTSSPVFDGGTPTGLSYSIAPTGEGISTPVLPNINSITGKITAETNTSAGSYIVNISNYSGKDKVYFYVTTSPTSTADLKTAISTGVDYFGDTADYNYILTYGITSMKEVFNDNTTFNGDISAWNTSSVTNMSYMFYFAKAFNGNISAWDTSSATDMSWMFSRAEAFNGDLSAWDTSNVTSISDIFRIATTFNGDISTWDTSSITNMSFMFYFAKAFNGDLSTWDTSSVTNMSSMFRTATSFNGDISTWDTSSVTNMRAMFRIAFAFNGDISAWDTSNVTNMYSMFKEAISFNGDISAWDTSNVANMYSMFGDATSFNGDISTWDTSSVTNMSSMFYFAKAFNGDISAWDTSLIPDMSWMFSDAEAFNGDISAWDTSNVTNMRAMFNDAKSFNGDISAWDTSNVTNMRAMFNDAKSFNGDISAWDVSSITSMYKMFSGATSFNGDISAWDISSATDMSNMFKNATAFTQNLDAWAPKLHASLNKSDMFDSSELADNPPCWYSSTDANEC